MGAGDGTRPDRGAPMILALTAFLGLALGFALQRGGFCGSAMLSTVLLHRDWGGVLATGFAIFVSMLGFAGLVALGWVVPDPAPLRLLSAVVGGVVFGVGMVLAGGCVTGTLFKAGEGRLPSILALLGIGLGATATDGGLLAPLRKGLVGVTRSIRVPAGLHEVVDLPYPLVAGTVGAVGLVVVVLIHVRRNRRINRPILPNPASLVRGAWPPVVIGPVVGILGWLAYLASTATGRNYPLGATGGVEGAFSTLLTGTLAPTTWTMALTAGMVAGSALSALSRRDWRLRSAEADTLLWALLGGFLVGFGVSVGRGCFMGNMVSGTALLSVHSLVFGFFTVLANQATTLVYLRGLR